MLPSDSEETLLCREMYSLSQKLGPRTPADGSRSGWSRRYRGSISAHIPPNPSPQHRPLGALLLLCEQEGKAFGSSRTNYMHADTEQVEI
jgi:hypothetical protein